MSIPTLDPNLIQPRGATVLVKLPETITKTAGGIILSDKMITDNKFEINIVSFMRCGEDAFSDRCAFGPKPAKGEKLLIDKYAGYLFQDENGNAYRMIIDENVKASIVDEPIFD